MITGRTNETCLLTVNQPLSQPLCLPYSSPKDRRSMLRVNELTSPLSMVYTQLTRFEYRNGKCGEEIVPVRSEKDVLPHMLSERIAGIKNATFRRAWSNSHRHAKKLKRNQH